MRKYYSTFISILIFFVFLIPHYKVEGKEYINENNSPLLTFLDTYDFKRDNPNKHLVSSEPLALIQGKITLPNGEVAPRNGITIKITSFSLDDFLYHDSEYYTILKIYEGESSAKYSFLSPIKNRSLSCQIMNAISLNSTIHYERQLYLTNYPKATKNINKAACFDLSTELVNECDFELQKLKKPYSCLNFPYVKGTIKLPEGDVAPKGGIEIEAFSSPAKKINLLYDSFYEHTLNSVFRIEEGENQVDYELPTPCGPRIFTFKVKNSSTDKYISSFYYNKNGIVTIKENASVININTDSSFNADIVMENAIYITGTMKIPENLVNYKRNLSVSLLLYDASDNTLAPTKSTFIIPKCETECKYKIKTLSGKYNLQYSINNDNPIEHAMNNSKTSPVFLQKGYLGEEGIVCDKKNAHIINVKDIDINRLNFTIEKTPCLIGTIKLPNNEKAGKKGLALRIVAKNSELPPYSVFSDVIIPKGQGYVNFSIPVQEGVYSLSYMVKPPSYKYYSNNSLVNYYAMKDDLSFTCDYIKRAYYTEDGYIKNFNIKSKNISNINFLINTIKYIEGEITLPKGCSINPVKPYVYLKPLLMEENKLPSNIVKSFLNNSSFLDKKYCLKIKPGTNKIKFKFPEQEGKYILICTSYNDLFPNCFYNEGEAKLDINKSKVISPANKGSQFLYMKLPKISHIKGTINLPEENNTSEKDIQIFIELIKLENESEMELFEAKEVLLQKYTSQVSYDFEVPPGSYIINYIIAEGEIYSDSRYYYKKNGITKDIKKATTIVVKNDSIENIDMTLIKRK